MRKETIGVIGGSGFVGHHLVARLVRDGRQVRLLTRRRRPGPMDVLPGVEVREVDLYRPAALAEALAGCDAVINLVGILNEAGFDGSGFRKAHVELVASILEACRLQGIRRLLHMAALGADVEGPSHYLRTKGEALRLLGQAEGMEVTSFSPSVIFGPGDSFFNRFADLLGLTPLVFPLVGAEARFAPVFVGDVVECFVRSIDDPATYGRDFELCGPEVWTLRELVAYTAETLGLARFILPLPDSIGRLQAMVMERLPGKPLSRDNLDSMKRPSVCSGPFPAEFGIVPASIRALVPTYLGDRTKQAGYDRLRRQGVK